MKHTIKSWNEVSLTYTRPHVDTMPSIKNSHNASHIFRHQYPHKMIDLKEFFYVMYLNNANKVLAVSKISEGGITGTVTDIRLIFTQAVLLNTTGMILCHNHPSGNLHSSEADLKLTRKVVEAGRLLDIVVLDHIILTSESHLSFADEGIMPNN